MLMNFLTVTMKSNSKMDSKSYYTKYEVPGFQHRLNIDRADRISPDNVIEHREVGEHIVKYLKGLDEDRGLPQSLCRRESFHTAQAALLAVEKKSEAVVCFSFSGWI